MNTDICERLGIEFPIFAFSHCRDVVAAVSKAGGMGVLGALAFSPEQLEIELTWIDEHVDGKPYGVDVVMPVKSADREAGLDDPSKLAVELNRMISQEHRDFVETILDRHHVPQLPEDAARAGGPIGDGILGWTAATGMPLVDVALAHNTALLASALGPPPKEVIDEVHARGIPVAALVGTAAQATRDVAKGIDIIIAQGNEAGGHTGEISTLVLIPEVVAAVGPDIPVLAAGGIGSGKQMAAAMALGAQGVWTGSLWLTVAEADTPPELLEKLLAATSRDTVRSRALTGKPARQLRTAWTEAWESPESPGTLPMPLQFILSSKAMARIHHAGAKELMGFPVGQIVGSQNTVRKTADVIFDMVDEYIDTVRGMNARLDETQEVAQ